MPTYCYKRPDGEIVDVFMTIKEMEQRERAGVLILDDGVKATRCFQAEHPMGLGVQAEWNNPILSDAAAIHPSQIAEFKELGRRHGCGDVNYHPDGRPELKSREQRRRYLKFRNLRDNNGGYGD